MSLEEVVAALEKHRWIFARTMPENPHEYTLRSEWDDDDLFCQVVEYIREHGYESWYHGRRYIQLDAGANFYWTAGAPVYMTIILNRKQIGGQEGGDTEMDVDELRAALEQFHGKEGVIVLDDGRGYGQGNRYRLKELYLVAGDADVEDECVIACELIPQTIVVETTRVQDE